MAAQKVHFSIFLIAGDRASCLPTGRADHPFPSIVCLSNSSLSKYKGTSGQKRQNDGGANTCWQIPFPMLSNVAAVAVFWLAGVVRWHLSGFQRKSSSRSGGSGGQQWFCQRQLGRRRTLENSRGAHFCPMIVLSAVAATNLSTLESPCRLSISFKLHILSFQMFILFIIPHLHLD